MIIIYGCGRAGPPIAKDTILPPPPILKRAIYRDGKLNVIISVNKNLTSKIRYENTCTGKAKTIKTKKKNTLYLTIPVNAECSINIYALNPYNKGSKISIYVPNVKVPTAKRFEYTIYSEKVELKFKDTFYKNIYRFPDRIQLPLNPSPVETHFFVDHHTKKSKTYRYIVRNVVISNSIEFEGKPYKSPPLRIIDTTPPPPPFQVIALKTEKGIKVEWIPSIVEDLAGYILYIRNNHTIKRLTDVPLKDTFYYLRVKTQWVGVSSVDTSGNKSRIKWEKVK